MRLAEQQLLSDNSAPVKAIRKPMNHYQELAKVLRILSIDAVEKAQSGHPGMPLGMADIATVLWQKFLRHSPGNPHWFNRDRFVLSNGHGSMLLYALLHMTGYKLSLEDLKNFRQLNSKTPGHPEFGHAPGVETTTGPLGQGLANAVGMAIAEQVMASQFNREGFSLVDHFTYTFVGDGCLMEGISHEACSLAGTLGLGKLIVFYDDNGISIDGKVESWFTDNTAERFRAYHWQVIEAVDGHDPAAIEQAILAAQANKTQPTLIMCKTVIGLGSSVAGSERAHGAPLGAEDVQRVREYLNWPYPPFEVPQDYYQQWNQLAKGQALEQDWLDLCQQYKASYPQDYVEFLRRINGDLPDEWQAKADAFLDSCRQQSKPVATRKASQQCIEFFAEFQPELFGGSADLTGSNNTNWSGTKAINHREFDGNYLYYGVREFAMAAIMNGMALHGGFIPYGGTFLVFADYARNALRLSALMEQRVVYVFTHDSIGLGEDGPTHQPVEHAAMLRMTPNMHVWRPADLLETAVAWRQAILHHTGPTSLLLSRQNLPPLSQRAPVEEIKKGGYILQESSQDPEVILMATGSELSLAVAAAEALQDEGVAVRVVSMPCVEQFLAQDCAYQEKVLPPAVRKRVAIEAAASDYWYRFVGLDGAVIGMNSFGASAPASELFKHFGFTVEQVIKTVETLLNSER